MRYNPCSRGFIIGWPHLFVSVAMIGIVLKLADGLFRAKMAEGSFFEIVFEPSAMGNQLMLLGLAGLIFIGLKTIWQQFSPLLIIEH